MSMLKLTDLVATWELAGVYPFTLLRFTDAMGGWSIGDWERDLRLSVGPAHCGGSLPR